MIKTRYAALHTSRHRQQEQNLVNNTTIDGLYFDGRKDQTYSRENDRRIIIQQEHISVIQEPGSNYFCHVSLKPPVSAANIKNGLLECLNKYKTNIDTLTVIGCDGTNVNTGWKGGAIGLLETHLNRPLQWSICLLHFNELPLRHLLQSLDGETKGPSSYSGSIGLLLKNCETLPLVSFKSIADTSTR